VHTARRLVLTTLALCIVALPAASAQARRHPRAIAVLAQAKGYRLVMEAGERGSFTQASVELTRTVTGGGTEAYSLAPFRASDKRVKHGTLVVGRGGRRATVTVDLGRLGSASLRFHQRGRAKRRLPAGCAHVVGRQKTRQGVVRGTLRLKLGGGHFKTVTVHRARGVLGAEDGFACQHIDTSRPASVAGDAYDRLAVASDHPYLLYQAIHQLDADTVEESGIRGERRGRYWVYGELRVDAPATEVTADIARGTAGLTGAGPLFTGTASFTGTADGSTPGTLAGDLTAHWDLFGDQPVAGSAPATLERALQGHL
jgi:hypothetical protein